MKEDKVLSGFLPETQLFSEAAFWEQIDYYGSVVMKPSEGAKGYGVVNVSKLSDNQYKLHSQGSKMILPKNLLEDFLNEKRYKRKLHIVQETVPLAEIGGCPFDLRVIVQRRKHSAEWQVTGKMVKLAADGYFITNVAKEILIIKEAIERSTIEDINVNKLEKAINQISLRTAKQLEQYYLESRIIGLDIGLTNQGHLYIIEANLRPSRKLHVTNSVSGTVRGQN